MEEKPTLPTHEPIQHEPIGKKKRIFTFAHLNAFMLFLLLGALAYILFIPITPATYSKPAIQDSANLQAGKTLTYTLSGCRNVGDGVVTTITRKLVSTSNPDLVPIVLSADTVTNPARCLDTRRTLIVPSDTPQGDYQLVITGVYQVIPFRKPIIVQARSDSFFLKSSNPSDPVVTNNSDVEVERGSSSTAPKPTGNSGGSPAPVTSNTTNNSTTNNTTTNNTQTDNGQEPKKGLVPQLLENLLGIGR